jgi:hypothetical protein
MFSAREWGSHLQNVIEEHDHGKKDLFTPKYFSWILMTYEHRFRDLLGMQSSNDGLTGIKKFSFMLSKAEHPETVGTPSTPITGGEAGEGEADAVAAA